MKSFLIIDSHALIHRFFHALPPLTSLEGEPIQAIYGLAGVILKIFKEHKPAYVAAAFDRPEKTFREEKFKEYKIHRPPAAPELISQLIKARELFELFNIKTLDLAGFEADDIIGTLVEKFKNDKELAEGKIVILSGDLDVLQLVENDKVVARIIKTGITNTVLYNEEDVRKRYLLNPSQLADYKGLVGDPSDNIPGVKGIGPKTATELLKDFGNVKEVFDSITIIPPKIAKKLEGQEQVAALSKELATIKRDVPIQVNSLDEFMVLPLQKEKLIPYFEKLGFQTLVERIG